MCQGRSKPPVLSGRLSLRSKALKATLRAPLVSPYREPLLALMS